MPGGGPTWIIVSTGMVDAWNIGNQPLSVGGRHQGYWEGRIIMEVGDPVLKCLKLKSVRDPSHPAS